MSVGIYSITNTVNGKRYIGSTAGMHGRWKAHRNNLRRGTHCNVHLQGAWKIHGEAAFNFEVIELVSIEELISREQFWIDFYRACDERFVHVAQTHHVFRRCLKMEVRIMEAIGIIALAGCVGFTVYVVALRLLVESFKSE